MHLQKSVRRVAELKVHKGLASMIFTLGAGIT